MRSLLLKLLGMAAAVSTLVDAVLRARDGDLSIKTAP